jgi:hypothetical protein
VPSAALPAGPAARVPVAPPPALEPAAPPPAADPESAVPDAPAPPPDALVPPPGLEASPLVPFEVRAISALELRVLVAQPDAAATAATSIVTMPSCLTRGQAATKRVSFCIMRAYS